MPVETVGPKMFDAVESIAELEPGDRTRLISLVAEILRSTTAPRTSWDESPLVPAANDLLGLLWLGADSAKFHRRHMRDSDSAEPGDAVRDEDEDEPGKYKVIFRTKDGSEKCCRGLPGGTPPSPRSKGSTKDQLLIDSDEGPDSHAHDASWKVLTDPKVLVDSRIAALFRLRGSPLEPSAVAYIATELDRASHITPEWRDAAVFAAEEIDFPPSLRERVGNALLHIASELRRHPDGPEKTVWSALRRGASLLPTTEVDRLLAFLAPGGAVDTRSVTLQCVSRMYEAEPPSAVPFAVADRAHRFAERFLDPDVFTPGEPSLIARNAVSALAAVGDPRLGGALTAVRSLGRPWLIRRIRDELKRVRDGWIGRGFSRENPAVANLCTVLASFG